MVALRISRSHPGFVGETGGGKLSGGGFAARRANQLGPPRDRPAQACKSRISTHYCNPLLIQIASKAILELRTFVRAGAETRPGVFSSGVIVGQE
jgi:hypothetical protein